MTTKQSGRTVPRDVDEEMLTPTPRETHLEELAEAAKLVSPRLYDITSKNPKALRVVHDHSGRTVAIPPGETKKNVLLHPRTVEQLSRSGGDLDFVPST